MPTLKERYIKAKQKLFYKAYPRLNDKQKEAVFTTQGPLLVLAGAGSGKTTVLVQRIAHIIKYGNAYFDEQIPDEMPEFFVSQLEAMADCDDLSREELDGCLEMFKSCPAKPWEVLSITFTNKAANEMKERLSVALGEQANEIWAGTFHSICVRILRRYIDRIGYDKNFTIYDTDDTKRLMTACLKELNIDEKVVSVKNALSIISRSKDKLIGYKAFAEKLSEKSGVREKAVARLYELFEKKKAASNALDFDDIIMFTVKLLAENDDVRKSYCDRFKYILVDEYQDTNMAQFYLVRLLCSEAHNIMVVGDDDQSIYKFRGATIENILSFDQCFKDAKVVRLEQNYRSKATILDAANAIIEHNKGRKGKTLWTSNEKGEQITVAECDNGIEEARFIVDTIAEQTKNGKRPFRDFAVLYRMNAQANTLETTFAKSGFPYRILGGMRFYEHKEIKDIIAYLCFVSNPGDMVRLRRIINVPKRGIGEATVGALDSICTMTGKTPLEIMHTAGGYPELSKAAVRLKQFAMLIDDFRDTADNEPLPVLMEKVIDKSGYRQMLIEAGEAEKERLENIQELISNAVTYNEGNESPTLAGFLEEVALVSDVDNYDSDADAVVLMTIHSAKGLEFPVVFLPGFEENMFPGAMSAHEQSELEEERRLAYVAVTRAKDKLYVTHCRSRLLFGRTQSNPLSRFVKEIPAEICDFVDNTNSQYGYGFDILGENPFGSYGNRTYLDKERTVVENKYFGSRFQTGGVSGIRSSQAQTGVQSKPVAPKTQPFKEVIFKAGDTVVHPNFGEGVVVSATKMGSDTYYEVAFDKVGTKKMMGKYAKMTAKE